MKLALHQPYFFPYIGYFAVLNASDIYVHSDTMQYMRHSWVNRNRILCGDGKWTYMVVPIKKGDYTNKINQTLIDYEQNWEDKIMAQLSFYKNTQKNSSSKKRNRTIESIVRFSLSEDFLIRYYSASIPHCCLARRL